MNVNHGEGPTLFCRINVLKTLNISINPDDALIVPNVHIDCLIEFSVKRNQVPAL